TFVALRESIGAPLSPGERQTADSELALLRIALTEEGFAEAWAEGRAMTLEQAVEYAMQEHAGL
ncbi:MAG TPA: hypothetical protein VKQ36_14315, partial [Ktedonobacterales bacterium]|nr:hypothetical protein [Ktedonobacterales bacterium]